MTIDEAQLLWCELHVLEPCLRRADYWQAIDRAIGLEAGNKETAHD